MSRYIKIIPLIILISLSLGYCGIPSNEQYDDLNAPKNLTVQSYDANGIKITFTGYNPETSFTGYNVYMALSDADLRTQKINHVVNGVVNGTIEGSYIVQNKSYSNYPTIQDTDTGVITARSTPTSITYIITKAPGNSSLSGSYYIGLTAYGSSSHLESGLSEVLLVTP